MSLGSAPPTRIYGFIVFAAAWLVFWIQPLAVRDILPVLGGSPAVWNTSMVFFQSALLAGYALAHFLARHASPARQLALLFVLWVCVALASPAGAFRLLGETPSALPPTVWLLGTLLGALAIPFVAASCLTPLVQSWLARSGAGTASADPYFLYSASNAGSAGALLAYPFLLEPLIGLEFQAWLWSAALLGLAPMLLLIWRSLPRDRQPEPVTDTRADRPPVRLSTLRILTLSALPSALLLAITRYLTTDVASVPLLWIVPLVLYLATFIHAFARREWIPLRVLERLLAPALILLAILYLLTRTVLAFGLLHLLVFSLAALYCHGALARLRPAASDLTRFYLLVSSGGLLGGLTVALLAPLVFVDLYEYPIALALVAALLPSKHFTLRLGHWLAAAVALGIVVTGLATILAGFDAFDDHFTVVTTVALTIVSLAAPALLILRVRPALLAGALLCILLVPTEISRGSDENVTRERTFFGVYRVFENEGVRTFYHGTTLHGAEWPLPDGSIESRTTYYGIGTPYFELMTALERRPEAVVIGLAGLGTGSLACYARPGDEVRIYEIDPEVVRLAKLHFSALRDCAPGAVVNIGDARLLLEREEVSIDVLALDTFSSGSIPVHLLTLEAFRSYLRVLAPQGVLAVHISNRYLDLEPVLAGLADRIGLAARIKRYAAPDNPSARAPSKSSHVVVLARDESTLLTLGLGPDWERLGTANRIPVWTDDYTSIVPLLRWW